MTPIPELVTYVFQVYPNASTLIQNIVSKHVGKIVLYASFGLTALWELIYDCYWNEIQREMP